ncbi:MAG: hypothetical protein JJ957_18255 [Pseudomonadales bacterium]|nr:hypothetical protein [Pseudomonadales bacterium]MBO6564406.1 hypothetical protein [Pseudomonadales bacterium]MBO6597879.1 hypothetical protein [Pseudomonadales bacterium]MBO6824287.1 hypothetical protein [Pseudomonadales bacterium]
MSNTEVRIFSLKDAIERDRAAHEAEVAAREEVVETRIEEQDSQPWELWLALAVGLTIIFVAAVI